MHFKILPLLVEVLHLLRQMLDLPETVIPTVMPHWFSSLMTAARSTFRLYVQALTGTNTLSSTAE